MKHENFFWFFFIINDWVVEEVKNKKRLFYIVLFTQACIFFSKLYTQPPSRTGRIRYTINFFYLICVPISIRNEFQVLYRLFCAAAVQSDRLYIALTGASYFMSLMVMVHTGLVNYRIIRTRTNEPSIEDSIEDERVIRVDLTQTWFGRLFMSKKERAQYLERHIHYFENQDAAQECAICYDVIQKGARLPCRHAFCRGCLESWHASQRKRNCPYCRQ